MDFGKLPLTELASVDLTLPPDTAFTRQTLKEVQNPRPLKIYVGCAKWGRKEWVGQIFPEKTKEKDFLKAYAGQFDCVELNATFYKIYGEATIAKWKEQVESNPDFLFFPKISRPISHIKRLRDAEELTTAFFSGVAAFGEKLGGVFLQLSDNFGPNSFDVLKNYLTQLPKDVRVFCELRHPGWFADEKMKEQVFQLFREQHIGSILTDASGRRDVLHMSLSTDTAFIRFVGNNLHPTDYLRVDEWIARLKNWQQLGLQKLFFFVHQPDEANSPKLAEYVIGKMNERLGAGVKGLHIW